ncbi:hypothetical protein DL765_008664 [Monosporascus sp. GIB2]|nr:hypothetical protein DL765_008664 [Monosporascus sp. GIB2]
MLRMDVGKKRKTGLAIDHWIMFVAMALITKSYLHGLGKHDADLQLHYQLVGVLKWSWIAMSPGMLVSALVRISITILLIRLFGVHAWFKWFQIVLTTIQVIPGSLVFIPSDQILLPCIIWAHLRKVDALSAPAAKTLAPADLDTVKPASKRCHQGPS